MRGGGVVASSRVRGAGSWSPLDLPSLYLWLDAADASTFSFSSGTAVSEWRDKSGHGRHLSQGTGSLQPERSASINSVTAVDFAGTKKLLGPNPGSVDAPQPVTILAVCTAAARNMVSAHSSVAVGFDDPTKMLAYAGGNVNSNAHTSGEAAVFVWKLVGGTASFRRNAVPLGSGSVGSAGFQGVTLSGWQTSTADPYGGVLGELNISSSDLTGPDLEAAELYLADKWGITI